MLTNCIYSYVQRSVLLGFTCPEAGGKPSLTALLTAVPCSDCKSLAPQAGLRVNSLHSSEVASALKKATTDRWVSSDLRLYIWYWYWPCVPVSWRRKQQVLGNEFVLCVISSIILFRIIFNWPASNYRRTACARLSHKYILIFPALGATGGHFQSEGDHQSRGGVCFVLLYTLAVLPHAIPCWAPRFSWWRSEMWCCCLLYWPFSRCLPSSFSHLVYVLPLRILAVIYRQRL